MFNRRCMFLEINCYMGPPGTYPQNLKQVWYEAINKNDLNAEIYK